MENVVVWILGFCQRKKRMTCYSKGMVGKRWKILEASFQEILVSGGNLSNFEENCVKFGVLLWWGGGGCTWIWLVQVHEKQASEP